jgi:transcriptional regulator GlxA family with amidase domain
MKGATVHAQSGLADARAADAIIVGSGIRTREIVNDPMLLAELRLDPACQLIGAQRWGTLVLAKLGLLGALPACTDLTTRPWVLDTGAEVLNRPFLAEGNIASAGGCLAPPYRAAWISAPYLR